MRYLFEVAPRHGHRHVTKRLEVAPALTIAFERGSVAVMLEPIGLEHNDATGKKGRRVQ